MRAQAAGCPDTHPGSTPLEKVPADPRQALMPFSFSCSWALIDADSVGKSSQSDILFARDHAAFAPRVVPT